MGKIIVIEGIDGTGKRTQAEKLVEHLKFLGKNVKLQSFPNYDSLACSPVKMYLGGEFGDINSLNCYQSSVLFSVDRLCTMILYEKFLSEGGILVLDRYTESNMIHQSTKLNDKNLVLPYVSWLEDFEFSKLKLPKPDVIFYLSMPIEASLKLAKERINYKNGLKKDIHEEDKNHLISAHNMGEYLANLLNWNKINCVDLNNNLKTIEQIHDQIFKIISKIV